MLNFIDNDFRTNFVNYIAKTDRTKLGHRFRMSHFRDKADISRIKVINAMLTH